MGSWVRVGAQASFTRMAWSWTGYDYDPVFRYKDAEPTFFQTGRNNAEARFWQTKIHEGDRRGTKSQIEIGSDGDSVKDHADVTKESSEDSASKDGEAEYEEEDDVRSLGDRDYQYGYGGGRYRDPGQRYFVYEETRHDGHKGRDRTMSIVSTISRKDDWRSPSKDYQYSYGEAAVEVERPPARGSIERQRGSVERKRGSVERKVKRQSEERPRQSEERSWQSVERPRQSEERPRQSEERYRQANERQRQAEERPRQADERYRQTEGTKREERQREPTDRRSEEYERYKEPDQERYKREASEADEGYIERGRDDDSVDGGHRHRGEEREKQPERIADWDRRPNVNRRKVHGHRGQPCAPGG